MFFKFEGGTNLLHEHQIFMQERRGCQQLQHIWYLKAAPSRQITLTLNDTWDKGKGERKKISDEKYRAVHDQNSMILVTADEWRRKSGLMQ